jgi:hypothetical protein
MQQRNSTGGGERWKVVGFHLSPAVSRKISSLSRREGVSRSLYLRRLVESECQRVKQSRAAAKLGTTDTDRAAPTQESA